MKSKSLSSIVLALFAGACGLKLLSEYDLNTSSRVKITQKNKSYKELAAPSSGFFVCNGHYSSRLDDLYVAIKNASPDLIITNDDTKEKVEKDSNEVFSSIEDQPPVSAPFGSSEWLDALFAQVGLPTSSEFSQLFSQETQFPPGYTPKNPDYNYNSLLSEVVEHIDGVKKDKRMDIICQTKKVANTVFITNSIKFEEDIVKAFYDSTIVMIQNSYSLDLVKERIDFAHSLAQSAEVEETQYVEHVIEALYDSTAKREYDSPIIKDDYHSPLESAKERIDFAHFLAQSAGAQEARCAEPAIKSLYDIATAKIKDGSSSLDSVKERIDFAHFLAQSAGAQEAQYAEPAIEALYNRATIIIKYDLSLGSAKEKVDFAHSVAQSAGVQEAQYAKPVVTLLCDKADDNTSKAGYRTLALIIARNAHITACDT